MTMTISGLSSSGLCTIMLASASAASRQTPGCTQQQIGGIGSISLDYVGFQPCMVSCGEGGCVMLCR